MVEKMNFSLNGRLLKYVNEECILIYCDSGNWKNNPDWKQVSICIHINGYKYIRIGDKRYYLHRVIGYLFLGLNIDDPKEMIDHIDRDKSNNNLENLRIVSRQQNSFNTEAKGFVFDKKSNKFKAYITLNGKLNHLGYFDTEEEARRVYLDAKQKYHLIE